MDYGERYADKKISAVNRELRKTYRTAQAELKKKLADFEKRFSAKNKQKKQELDEGKISKQDYKDWLTGQVFIRSQFESSIRQVNAVMLDCNRQALNIMNNARFDVFAENYNYNAWKAERSIAVSFNVYSAESVARLMIDEPQLLPKWKIDEKKDYIWNYNRVNNIVRQGIIQGEGVPEITDRLCSELSSTNESKMRMFSRTAINSAQNAGRQKQMEDAAEMGIEVKKRWIATRDSRTRDAHRDLDGEEVPFDHPFKNEYGEIMFPGDPTAKAANVFNCRCSMRTIYPKYEDYSRKWGEGDTVEGVPYEEWKQGKKKRGEVQPEVKANVPSYYAPIDEMAGMDDKQREAINKRFMELDIKYHANVDGGVHGLLERDQAEYDLQFDQYRNHLLEENPRMRKSTAEKRTLEIMGERPDYIPGHGKMRYLETGGEYREKDNLYTMLQDRENWQDFRHTITLNPYSLGSSNSLDDDIAERKAWMERNAERLAEGKTLRSRSNVGMGNESTFIHEYGHAIDYTYGVSTNPAFIAFYESLTEEEIRSVSRYAGTNEKEFIAEAFSESYMGDTQGEISKRFMKILEGIINDKH